MTNEEAHAALCARLRCRREEMEAAWNETSEELRAAMRLAQANIRAFADAVQKAKPQGAKGHFINRIAISSTMGPGVKIEPASVFNSGGQAH